MDYETVTQVEKALQYPHSSANPESELNPAAKRLLLSAHLGLVCKKLRRGLSVEEREIVALIPFTVPNGWSPADGADVNADQEDLHWSRLVETAAAHP